LTDAARTIAAIFRIELPRLVARLARVVRDVGRAEELAQDAMVIALEHWPAEGVPDNPGAWLMTTAKRRAIDLLRRVKLAERTHEEFGHDSKPQAMRDPDDDICDDLLRLVFTACHPVLRPRRVSRSRCGCSAG
jgi:predicted RNA polymerase sigma factor